MDCAGPRAATPRAWEAILHFQATTEVADAGKSEDDVSFQTKLGGRVGGACPPYRDHHK